MPYTGTSECLHAHLCMNREREERERKRERYDWQTIFCLCANDTWNWNELMLSNPLKKNKSIFVINNKLWFEQIIPL